MLHASERRLVGCLGASFVWVGTGEPLMPAYMHQSTWVGKVEGGLGRAGCRLMRRVVRLTRVATGGQASEHRARAMRVDMLLCARWKVTHLLFVAADFFALHVYIPQCEYGPHEPPGTLRDVRRDAYNISAVLYFTRCSRSKTRYLSPGAPEQ